ncbi:hypothetical protein OG552_10265 [Streptomyces sp. NBC_01476]|uniref:hypothetical protein n=1 Tax=Streptomyces sp. NBC_01476 TaxID=2903881 RepID=UPI002E36EE75|nr:hypothetical protein [Streptomyces sp. NBC_01476]
MTTAVRTPPHHDTTTCYTEYRCRLPQCVKRYNTINQARLKARREGTYTTFVDAEPARRHILRLRRAGMSANAIGAAAGLTTQSILEFVRPAPGQSRGRRQRTTPATEAKILAVTVQDRTTGRIDATATRRRIQALVAIGWPVNHVARHAGLFDVNAFVFAERSRVYMSTAKAVAAAYDKLRTRNPERHGVTPQHVQAAKNRAAKQGWPPPTYWDNPDHPIGDRHFEPKDPAEIIADEARFLMTVGGLDATAAAKRLRRAHSYIAKALLDYPEREVAA